MNELCSQHKTIACFPQEVQKYNYCCVPVLLHDKCMCDLLDSHIGPGSNMRFCFILQQQGWKFPSQMFCQCLELKAVKTGSFSLFVVCIFKCTLPTFYSWDDTGKLGMHFTLRIAVVSRIGILWVGQSCTYFKSMPKT